MDNIWDVRAVIFGGCSGGEDASEPQKQIAERL